MLTPVDALRYLSRISSRALAQSMVAASRTSCCGSELVDADAGGTASAVATGSGGAGGIASGGVGGSAGGSAGTGGVGCAGPTTLVGDTLDPDHVYLAGWISQSSCDQGAIAHWSTPNSAVVGFPCTPDNFQHAWVRPTDGRFLYLEVFGTLREFHCDECPYAGGTYPPNPNGNAPVIPTPGCGSSDPDDFLVSPTGLLLHRCQATGAWHDATGELVYDGPDQLLHLGYGDVGLTEARLIDFANQTTLLIVGLPAKEIVTIRAKYPDKFLLVMRLPGSAPNGGGEELWQVDAAGNAELLGSFAAIPEGEYELGGWYSVSSKLDACGRLLQRGDGVESLKQVIFRREVGGVAEIVYMTDGYEPLVQALYSALVTSP